MAGLSLDPLRRLCLASRELSARMAIDIVQLENELMRMSAGGCAWLRVLRSNFGTGEH
jgi:hypothetical protein